MDSRTHWEKIYGEKAPNSVSWYRPHLENSLSLIERVASRDSAIIDVGGGESTLVDDLLSHGHENVTVLDVSQTAIDANKTRLGKASERVHWLVADITKAELTQSAYDLWHDRAVFHFLTAPNDRVAYVRQAARASLVCISVCWTAVRNCIRRRSERSSSLSTVTARSNRALAPPASEPHVQFREAECKRIVLVDEHDVDRIAEGVRKDRGQFKASEAGT